MITPETSTKSALIKATVFAGSIFAVVATYAVSPPVWTKFESENDKFSVLMPGTPKKTTLHNKSFVGDIETVVHTARDGKDTYVVDRTSLPGFAVSFSGKDGIYDHAKSAVLKKTYSKAISFTDVTLDGVQGKKLAYDTPTKPGHPEMQGETRFFLVENDVVQHLTVP